MGLEFAQVNGCSHQVYIHIYVGNGQMGFADFGVGPSLLGFTIWEAIQESSDGYF